MKSEWIAPCGMNCGLCSSFLRTENPCPGCFSGRKLNDKPIKCGRKLCTNRTGFFCFDCNQFPCDSIKRLDERYRKRYDYSEIENLLTIQKQGLAVFLTMQESKYEKTDLIFDLHQQQWVKKK